MSTATPRSSRDALVSEAPRTDRLDAVRLTDLHKSSGDVAVIDDVDLTISPDEVAALLGPNGVGKMTTTDMILGLGCPTSGDARVFGVNPRQTVDRGLVATVMQIAGLLPDVTVRETVQLTASLFSHRIDAEDVMCRAGVTDFASRIAKKCSRGRQQCLRLVMALANDPTLFILDEPTTGMDAEGRHSFWEVIHTDAECRRATAFATHYLEGVGAFANRIVLMCHGRIIADGTAAEIHASVSGYFLRAILTCAPGRLRDTLIDLQICGQVHDVEILGSSFTLSLTDIDAVAALPLSEHLAQDPEITSRGLKDAFMILTSNSASIPSAGASA